MTENHFPYIRAGFMPSPGAWTDFIADLGHNAPRDIWKRGMPRQPILGGVGTGSPDLWLRTVAWFSANGLLHFCRTFELDEVIESGSQDLPSVLTLDAYNALVLAARADRRR